MASVVKRAKRRVEARDSLDVHFGSMLRRMRGAAGLSQEQLGIASGLTFQQIQKYESGANRISASRIFRLAGILKVPVESFFSEAGNVSPSEIGFAGLAEEKQFPMESEISDGRPPRSPSNREILELVRAYSRIMDDKQRRRVYELIKSLAEQSS